MERTVKTKVQSEVHFLRHNRFHDIPDGDYQIIRNVVGLCYVFTYILCFILNWVLGVLMGVVLLAVWLIFFPLHDEKTEKKPIVIKRRKRQVRPLPNIKTVKLGTVNLGEGDTNHVESVQEESINHSQTDEHIYFPEGNKRKIIISEFVLHNKEEQYYQTQQILNEIMLEDNNSETELTIGTKAESIVETKKQDSLNGEWDAEEKELLQLFRENGNNLNEEQIAEVAKKYHTFPMALVDRINEKNIDKGGEILIEEQDSIFYIDFDNLEI